MFKCRLRLFGRRLDAAWTHRTFIIVFVGCLVLYKLVSELDLEALFRVFFVNGILSQD